MKREQLMTVLNKAIIGVDKNPIKPEMGCFRIRGKEIRTCNGSVMIRTVLDEDLGDFMVSAPKLHKLILDLDCDEIQLEVKDGELKIKDKQLLASYKVQPPMEESANYLDGLDFDVPEDSWRPISSEVLEGLQLCKYVASREVSHGALCGVLLEGSKILAGDGIQISVCSCRRRVTPPDQAFIFDTVILEAVAAFPAAVVKWAARGTDVFFLFDDGSVMGGRLLPGEYPDMMKYVKEADTLKLSVTFPEEVKTALIRHITQQADVLELDKAVQLDFSGKELRISSTDAVLYTLTETLPLAKAVEPAIRFKIHPAFLLKILKSTSEMKHAAGGKFVAFVSKGYMYLTTVEWVGDK